MDLVYVMAVVIYLSLMGLIAILDAELGFFLEWKSKWKASPNAPEWTCLIPRFRRGFGLGGMILFFAGLAANIYAWTFKGIVHPSTFILWAQLAVILFMSCYVIFEWLLRGGALTKSEYDSPAWAVAVSYALTAYMIALLIIDGGAAAQRLTNKQTTGVQFQLESEMLEKSRDQKCLMRDASAFWLWLGFAVAGDAYLPKKRKPEATLGKYAQTLQKL